MPDMGLPSSGRESACVAHAFMNQQHTHRLRAARGHRGGGTTALANSPHLDRGAGSWVGSNSREDNRRIAVRAILRGASGWCNRGNHWGLDSARTRLPGIFFSPRRPSSTDREVVGSPPITSYGPYRRRTRQSTPNLQPDRQITLKPLGGGRMPVLEGVRARRCRRRRARCREAGRRSSASRPAHGLVEERSP